MVKSPRNQPQKKASDWGFLRLCKRYFRDSGSMYFKNHALLIICRILSWAPHDSVACTSCYALLRRALTLPFPPFPRASNVLWKDLSPFKESFLSRVMCNQ